MKSITEYKVSFSGDGKWVVNSYVTKNGTVFKNFVSEFDSEQSAKDFAFCMNLTA